MICGESPRGVGWQLVCRNSGAVIVAAIAVGHRAVAPVLNNTCDVDRMSAQSPQTIEKLAQSGIEKRAENFEPSAKKSAPPTVLVVDDEPLIRWSVAQTLTDGGYQVAEAHDAVSAMQAFLTASAGIDVVLLDLHLPDADDLRVLMAMHTASPATPVIVMTAYGSPELADEARRLGAFAVVDKPFEMDDLPPLVERALARHLC